MLHKNIVFFYFQSFYIHYNILLIYKMSSSVMNNFRQKSPTHKKEVTNYLFGCCDDNNIETISNNQFNASQQLNTKNVNSYKQIKYNNDYKPQIKIKHKHLSPNVKSIYLNKIHIKDEQTSLRKKIKSLQLKKQSTEDAQSPARKLQTKKTNKNNKISVISMKKCDLICKPTLKQKQKIQDKNGNLKNFTSQTNNHHFIKSSLGTKINKTGQNKFENQDILDHPIRENNLFFSFNNNQKQRQNTACFNEQAKDCSINAQQKIIKEFSPSARLAHGFQIPNFTKTTQKLNKFIQRSPTNKNICNSIKTPQKRAISPILIQIENKNTQNLQQYKESTNDFIKLKQEQAKFTFRENSAQNHLTMASDGDNSKILDANINPFQTITTQDNNVKKQQQKITNNQILKTLVDCRNQLGVVKQSVISEMGDQRKDSQHQSYLIAKTKVINSKNAFFNPQYDSQINAPYGQSYNPSLIFPSYKQSPPRYLIKNLSSATVNSIMQPVRDSEIWQKVQQSVVMLDFFNHAPHYQRKLQ